MDTDMELIAFLGIVFLPILVLIGIGIVIEILLKKMGKKEDVEKMEKVLEEQEDWNQLKYIKIKDICKHFDIIKKENSSQVLVFAIFIGLMGYTYFYDIKPFLSSANEFFDNTRPLLSSVNEFIENKNQEPQEDVSQYINWGKLERIWTADKKEIILELTTSYFNGNLLYKIIAKPFDNRFQNSNLSRVTVDIIDKNNFSLFNINTHYLQWERDLNTGGISVGFVANGRIQMSEKDYQFLLENKNILNINWDY